MKETVPAPHAEQLPPSLAENVRDRISAWWKFRNPLSPNNEVSKTWRQELARVADSWDTLGSPKFGTRLLSTVTETASRWAGISAFVGDIALGAALTGWGGDLLLNNNAKSAYMVRHRNDSINYLVRPELVRNVAGAGRLGLGIGVVSYGPLSHLSILSARVAGGLADVEANTYMAVKKRFTK